MFTCVATFILLSSRNGPRSNGHTYMIEAADTQPGQGRFLKAPGAFLEIVNPDRQARGQPVPGAQRIYVQLASNRGMQRQLVEIS